MKRFKRIKATFLMLTGVGLASFAMLISCAGQHLPMGQEGSAFGLLSLVEEGEGLGPGGGFGRHGLQFMLKDLNLTEAQQSQLQALREEVHGEMSTKKEGFKAVKSKLQTAFLSDNFDQAALKSEIQTLMGEHKGEHIATIASSLLKAYAVLTPEQRTILEDKLNTMEARMQMFINSPLAKMNGDRVPPHLEKMANELGLSQTQRDAFKNQLAGQKADFKTRFEELHQVKTAILNELNSGQASVESLSTLLMPVAQKMGGQLDNRLTFMAAAHQILTPEQRQQLVTKMETMRHQHHGRKHWK